MRVTKVEVIDIDDDCRTIHASLSCTHCIVTTLGTFDVVNVGDSLYCPNCERGTDYLCPISRCPNYEPEPTDDDNY